MRSTQKKGPRTLALKKARASAAEVITSRAAASVRQLYAANQAAAAALAPLPSIREIRARIAKAAGYREPPEPEAAMQATPKKPPLAPADAAARPIAMTTLPDGCAWLEIGEERVLLSADELAALGWAIWPSPRRGSE